MPATVEILTIPIGSQLVSTINKRIDPPEPDSKNDFRVLFLFSENVTQLTEAKITVSAVDSANRAVSGASLVSLEGKNSVWMATVRPPQTSGIVTATVAANAVSQGNPQTSKSIRISTTFPDADAESPTQLFSTSGIRSIGVTSTRIIVLVKIGRTFSVKRYTHAGVEQPSEARNVIGTNPTNTKMDIINGDFIFTDSSSYLSRFRDDGTAIRRIEQIHLFPYLISYAHSHLGFMSVFETPTRIRAISFDGSDSTDFPLTSEEVYSNITYQGSVIYMSDSSGFGVAEITEDNQIHFRKEVNINPQNNSDIAIYGDTLYLVSTTAVYTLNIRRYRPIAKNTKTTIYPVFAEAGDTIDLKQFSPDAERIVFDVGYDKQPQLSINTSNKLVVGSGAQTCLVKLKAINRIDATETDSFGFYLIIRQATAPVWREVSELTMGTGSRYDLFQLVPDAASIEFRSGRTRLAGSSLSNGVFTVGPVGGVAEFTARKGNLRSHIAITIDVVQGVGSERSEVSGYRIEIAGIDVTSDSVEFPSVSETLDPVVINEYRVNEASITLRNVGGKYNSDLAGNFWETHGLNAGGFQNAVKIYLKYLDGSERLHFSGVINESFGSVKGATFKMNCSDISSRLRKALVQGFGTLEKWDALRKQSDEDSYAGIYVPDPGLGPMQVGTGKARSGQTDLAISRLELPSEGPAPENTGYMTPNEFRTAGGFLPENPLLRFMGEHQSEDVRFLIHQLAINKEIYNVEIDIPGVEVEDPFLLNRGSVAFSVEPTRTTRLPVDWVHDPTNGRILILLSNPEAHISDLLVQYNLSSDSYRVLHTFDRGIAVHRIERRSGTHYYILTSKKIAQDRSARQGSPRQTDSTGYTYDSISEGSEIKIYHYNSSTGTLTEHVAEDNNLPPQLGIHYHVGFENKLYIDTFEGIRLDYRGAFKWHSGNLYYRYAKDGEFGVARVNTGGTTTKMIGQGIGVTNPSYGSHLNFAFDLNSSGTIYFAYMTGDENTSTLFIKRRTSNGTVTTIFSETRGIGHFDELGFDFGAFLGVHEVLFHNNQLYVLVPIQKADLGDGTRSIVNPDVHITQRSAEKSGERNVSTSTNLNPSNIVLAPGEDIPLRINFDGTVSGATRNDLTVYGGTIQSFSISSNRIDVTIRPDSKVRHKTIIIDVAENAVAQTNEAWRITIDFETKRSRQKAAGMVLYSVATNVASASLTVIDKWDFVHQAGCNLVVHDGSIHYVEQPPASQKFKSYNPDLENYNAEMKYNVIEESLGALKKITSSGEVEELGNVWHTDRPYNIAQTRMLSIGDDLHLCVGYGNADEVLRYNSLVSAADNMVHIVYGKTLHYVLPRFQPSGSVYAALASLAKAVNATLSFEKNVIMITDRRPYRALTDGATGIGTGDLSFSNANKAFPSNGYLLIGKEILKYSGITGGAFTGVQRGVLGSPIADHADDSRILYLDTLIQTEKLGSPYKSVVLQLDVNRLFNVIRDSGGIAEVRDEESIALYGERPYTLDLGLTRHEKAWIEEIFKSYLKELSTLQHIVNIQVVPDFSLRLGQIVPFFYKNLISGMRIVSVRYERRTTHIKGRTVAIV